MKYSIWFFAVAGLLGLGGCNKTDDPEWTEHSKWIARIVSYAPAPGQFINTDIGTREAAESLVGGKTGCLSLGGFGGAVVFQFDHEVQNIEGPDFVIFGNAFDGSSEPGIVEVSPDGETWFRLGGEADEAEGGVADYEVTYLRPERLDGAEEVVWTDNRGGSGAIEALEKIHPQSYWPAGAEEERTLTFRGRRLPDNAVWNGVKYVLEDRGEGYADNWSADYTVVVGGDPDTRNGNKFDLDRAVDGEGRRVELRKVRQIRVYTAVNQQVGGTLGEVSTEICGALSLSAGR